MSMSKKKADENRAILAQAAERRRQEAEKKREEERLKALSMQESLRKFKQEQAAAREAEYRAIKDADLLRRSETPSETAARYLPKLGLLAFAFHCGLQDFVLTPVTGK